MSILEKHHLEGKRHLMASLMNNHVTPCTSAPTTSTVCSSFESNVNKLGLEAGGRTGGGILEKIASRQQKVATLSERGSCGLLNSAARRQKLLTQKLHRLGQACVGSGDTSSVTPACLLDTEAPRPDISAVAKGRETEKSPPGSPAFVVGRNRPYQISPVKSQPEDTLRRSVRSSSSSSSDLEGCGSQSGILSGVSAAGLELDESTGYTPLSAKGSERDSSVDTSDTERESADDISYPKGKNFKETSSAVGEERGGRRREASPFSNGALREAGRRTLTFSKTSTPQRRASDRDKWPLTDRGALLGPLSSPESPEQKTSGR